MLIYLFTSITGENQIEGKVEQMDLKLFPFSLACEQTEVVFVAYFAVRESTNRHSENKHLIHFEIHSPSPAIPSLQAAVSKTYRKINID